MPPQHTTPGVFVEEITTGVRTITGVSTSVTAFVGYLKHGPMDSPQQVNSFGEFEAIYGGLDSDCELGYAVQQFFLNGGINALIIRVAVYPPPPHSDLQAEDNGGLLPGATELIGSQNNKTGMYALEDVDIFNILCIPDMASLSSTEAIKLITQATVFCEKKRAFLIVDIPNEINTPSEVRQWITDNDTLRHKNTAAYFPHVMIADPLDSFLLKARTVSGTLAGVYARTDTNRGVWKAPAGAKAELRGVQAFEHELSSAENDILNPLGINALRTLPGIGRVSWGARTLDGSNQRASEWKYIPVVRTALFIEQSLERGLKWAVFEPNDEPLWAQIRLNVGAFMHDLFRRGAFQGTRPSEAYLVKCDSETTSRNDINMGIVNVLLGFAPLKPAEFVVIRVKQKAGSE